MEYCKRFLRVLLVFVLANLALLETLAPPPDWLTLPLLFGLLFFSLTRRTPSLEDLSVVQQYFDKFLCELAQEA